MHFIFDNETYSVYIPRQPRSSRGVSGDGPVGGARRGVPRLRLVTNAPGGPGPRPPGTMTWPRGARCTDPEEMPEMEARAPAQNRHGGAPRGARPPLGDDKALRKRLACRAKARSRASWTRFGTPRVPLHPSAVSALRHPSFGVDEGRFKPRAQRVAGMRRRE